MISDPSAAGSPKALAEHHLLAENERDLAAAMAVFSDDCRYEIPALGIDLSGREAVAAYHAELFETFPDWSNEELELYEAPGRVFARIRVARTHDRQWGAFAATGRRIVTHSLAEFPVAADGLLGGEIVHLNPLDALAQIGAIASKDPTELALAQQRRLAGSTALVVGASRGIGAAVAAALAAEGAAVAIAARGVAQLDRVAAEIREATGASVVPISVDASSGEEVEACVATAVAELGGLDVLVNCAGTTVRKPAAELTLADWDRVIAVNLRAAFAASRAAAAGMVEKGGGSIVNIASLSSHFGIRRGAAYGASKGGLAQLTKALALEWGSDGVRVNAIAPGYVETELTRGLVDDEARYESVRERIPLGRWALPEDIAGVAVMLCTPLAGYVTGQVIYVDGGYTADG